jgi:predicted Zn-dependent protease
VNLGDLNAFSLPGGYVYVNRGLVEKVHTEGELAGVLAHEIAHVALRHGTHQMTQAYAAQTGLGLLERLLGGNNPGSTTRVLEAVGGLGLNTLFLKFSRSAESEADAYGARIMARSGYSPVEMASFFHFMAQQAASNPSKVATFFSDHPSPANREAHILTEARGIPVARVPAVGGLASSQLALRRLPPAPGTTAMALANGR